MTLTIRQKGGTDASEPNGKVSSKDGKRIPQGQRVRNVLLDSKYHRDVEKKRDGDTGKYKTSIHGHTGYFLAGAKPISSADRLN